LILIVGMLRARERPQRQGSLLRRTRMDLTSSLQGAVPLESDTTERQGAEERLRYSAAQFEMLVNQAPLGIYLVDAEFRIAQVNPPPPPAFGDIPGRVLRRRFAEINRHLR